MTPELLSQLTGRFRIYVDRYRTDGQLHPMHQLKLEHTIRVAADARTIATGMNWPEEEVCLAEAVGLFHDVARFPQFKQYRSFSDADTVDHGELGVQTLGKENLLEGVAAEPRALILHSVQYHNKKDLPSSLTAHEEKHLRLIRDADRLDIFFICWDSIKTGHIHDHPEIIMNIDFNSPPTPAVLEQFERGEKIDYRCMKSMSDRFVLQLSWIHDLSYASTKRLVRERGILDKFIDVMPVKNDRLLRCFDKTSEFLGKV
ncbi:MAG: HD domain-containing protein [Kiritimatiellaceae bacterium]|nr:HD domain-containing protein [Kiritimatiellaceae bacterium]